MGEDYELIIGDKRYSSWSLRPWLALTAFGIPFKETMIRLRRPETLSEILPHSPSGKIPVLKTGGLAIGDSLAIIEFLAEQHPNKSLWPADRDARAIARSVSAEMHSSFQALRNEFPMDFTSSLGFPDNASGQARADIARIVAIWGDCRRRFGGGGDFLFGAFSLADAMYAPVASRFRTYQVELSEFGDDGSAARYRDTMLAMPEMQAWEEAARAE
ncbi:MULTISPECIES: glutathione S-transferase family protein [Rhodomicrobium]|uniref:glutathione S-transferase family protein n=1 Tax=Rhodomicrobium TaxID=1068 RepID=UPI000B4BFDB6|nr:MULTISPECIES: glutathione S-transferase family protein [Rhodomicrobium]